MLVWTNYTDILGAGTAKRQRRGRRTPEKATERERRTMWNKKRKTRRNKTKRKKIRNKRKNRGARNGPRI